MKAYQYNATTGLYEGEIFEDSGTLRYVEGVTTIAPPEHGPGLVPVFDTATQHWELVPLSIARQLLLGRSQ